MFEKKRVMYIVCMAVLLLAASACGAADQGPALIGAYPASIEQAEWFEPLPDAAIIVYHAMIDLQVRSVSDAFDEVKDLAHEHGGYVTSAQIWYEDRDEQATVVVSVPSFNFDLLYEELLRLGKLERETVSGDLEPGYGRNELIMSTITVHLSERSSVRLPELPSGHATATFERAFGVVSAIFSFLLDAAIWILVVIGPFVLIGWAGRKLWLHFRQPRPEVSEAEEEKLT